MRNKENSNNNNFVWFYPERALQKASSKSTVKTVIALASKQGRSYKVSRFRERQRFFMPLPKLVVQLKAKKNLRLTLKNAFVFVGSKKGDNGFENILKCHFTLAIVFVRDSSQQYAFMHKCNSTLDTLSSVANQTASLPLVMRF